MVTGSQTTIETCIKHRTGSLSRINRSQSERERLEAALWRRLAALGLPLEAGTGGRTKWNRTQRDLPKANSIDAACVGASTPERLRVDDVTVLTITAQGHGTRQMAHIDGIGFPRLNKAGKQQIRSRQKRHFGFMRGISCGRLFRQAPRPVAGIPAG